MAIANYAELVAAVQDYFDRDDLLAEIPLFIKLAEANLDRTLRSASLFERATTSLNEEYEDLPPDFASMLRLYITNTTPRYELQAMSPTSLVREYPASSAGRPRAYAIVGKQLQFAPVPNDNDGLTIELVYYRTVSSMALSSINTQNIVLTTSPDIYLFGVLAEAAIFFQDDAASERFVALREAAIRRANEAGDEGQAAGVLQMNHGREIV